MNEVLAILLKEWFARQQIVFIFSPERCILNASKLFFFWMVELLLERLIYNQCKLFLKSFIFALKINIFHLSALENLRSCQEIPFFFFQFDIWIYLQLEHQQLYCPQISGMFQAENWFYSVGDLKECTLGFIK